MKRRATESLSAVTTGNEPAGPFSEWLRETRQALARNDGGVDVPCGTCAACCQSSMFIHIRPDETNALRRIPKELLFPAPGYPKGHVLMGYDDKGRCPMLRDKACSIYEDRPQTCRDYDCRIFAATAFAVPSQPMIAAKVATWRFAYPEERDRTDQDAVLAAASFLRDQRDAFPPNALPTQPTHLALLAVRVYEVFLELQGNHQGNAADANLSAAQIAAAVLAATADVLEPD